MFRSIRLLSVVIVSAASLWACGGGEPQTAASKSGETPSALAPAELALQQQGSQLNAQELEQAASQAIASQKQSLEYLGPRPMGIYRLYNPKTGGYVLTGSSDEVNQLILAQPHVKFEGVPFIAYVRAEGFSVNPVHRFFDKARGVHFYTISEAERAFVAANLPKYTHEGVAFAAETVPSASNVPVYRFFSPSTGAHFYTSDAQEASKVRAQPSAYRDEGIAFYVGPNAIMTISGSKNGVTWIDESTAPYIPEPVSELLNPVTYFGSGSELGEQSNPSVRQHLLVRDQQSWQVIADKLAEQVLFWGPVPSVDFNTQQVLALKLSSTSSCSGEKLMDVRQWGNVVQVSIGLYAQPPGRMCAAVMGESTTFVVIPRSVSVQVLRQAL